MAILLDENDLMEQQEKTPVAPPPAPTAGRTLQEEQMRQAMNSAQQQNAAAVKPPVQPTAAVEPAVPAATEAPAATAATATSAPSAETEKADGLDVAALYSGLKDDAKKAYEKREQEIKDQYGTEITDTDTLLKGVYEEKRKMNEKDETARRRDKAYALISGLGDAMSGIANLYGTTQGATAQKQAYALPEYMQKAEAMRKERKLESQTVDERRKELETQLRTLRSSKDKDLKNAYAEYEKELRALGKEEAKATVDVYKQGVNVAAKAEDTDKRLEAKADEAQAKAEAKAVEKAEKEAKNVKEATFTDSNGQQHKVDLRNRQNWKQEATSYLTNLFESRDPRVEQYQEEYEDAKIMQTKDSKALENFFARFLYGPLVYEYLTK